MNKLQEMLDNSMPAGKYRLQFNDIEQMASDIHYHAQLIDDDESDMIIKDKYAISLTPEERAIMVNYHELILKLHMESWVASA